jgi:hypothetical protein
MIILANIIFFIHLLLCIACFIIPFITNDMKLLSLYSFVIVFIIFHWAINDDTCILTYIEHKLRNIDTKDTFFDRLISPIYKLDNDVIKLYIMVSWTFVQYKLTYRYL